MNCAALLDVYRDRPFFEAKELPVWFEEPKGQIQARLSRWVAQKKLIQLRRGFYLIPPSQRRVEPEPGYLSNYLYSPSYVSLHAALERFGMIPEAVHEIEAVTPRPPARWTTPAGRFRYYSLRQDRFWGYRQESGNSGVPAQKRFLIAFPEKALIDLFHFSRGEWTAPRIREMRFQAMEQVDRPRLAEYAGRFASPRVSRAVRRLLEEIS